MAACDRCFAAHHEECWQRNGRCSTFRCAGTPRTMRGDDLPTVLQVAMDRANEQPQTCPFCANTVYVGKVESRPIRPPADPTQPATPGLMFQGKGKPNPHNDWFGKRFLSRMLGNRSWFLPGAHLKARSCGKCRRLFLWGVPVDEAYIQKYMSEQTGGERYCPHCTTVLWAGRILVGQNQMGGARFSCDNTPDFHRDWFGHTILDRYLLNKWNLSIPALPAYSCPECHYTEVAGRPIYRFL